MADEDTPTEISGTEARSGSTPHVTRHVLVISLVIVIVLFAIILIWGMR
jgi:hypothetical protein